MAEIHLIYNIPLYVVVNTDTGEVEQVVVADEDTPSFVTATEADGEPVDTTDVIATARHIADVEPWPAWTLGW
jgi:hypothetical protein